MLEGKKVLAIIPARGGSKRLKNKNILDLDGKPLIAHTIETALQNKFIDKVIVSTDSDEIYGISELYGATSLLRPHEFSTDTASSVDVVIHAIAACEKFNEVFDVVILLQPTSPLRSSKDITNAFKVFSAKKAKGVVSVCACEHSPLWCNTLPNNHSMTDFISKDLNSKRSQDLPFFYRVNGAIYICNIDDLRDKKTFLFENVFASIMAIENSVDIDEKSDFKYAEFLLENNYQDEK